MSEKKADVEDVKREILERQRDFWRLFEALRVNLQKALIWGVFFFVLWLLRDFFTLIFLTFVFSFVSTSAVRVLGRWVPQLPWKGRVACVFTGFLVLITLFVWLTIPQIRDGVSQLNATVRALPQTWEEKIDPALYENSRLYRRLVTRAEDESTEKGAAQEKDGEQDGEQDGVDRPPQAEGETRTRRSLWEIERVQQYVDEWESKLLAKFPVFVTDVVTGITAAGSLFFLSFIFSFLIVFDLDKLGREVAKLEKTKLEDFYVETVRNIVKFGAVLGKVLEAQAAISLVNTLLTATALYCLGIANVGFLSIFVFLCGLIPVAGVFISSTPICLIALYLKGIPALLTLVGVITCIHFLEAYVLNPRIMGAALHVNPVLVLVILVIGHHSLGIWGLLLGLPICYYFFTHVIKREDREIGLRARFKRKQGVTRSPGG